MPTVNTLAARYKNVLEKESVRPTKHTYNVLWAEIPEIWGCMTPRGGGWVLPKDISDGVVMQ